MLERIAGKFSDIFRQLSGKAVISEKNIRDAVDEIKIALLEADVNVRVVRRFVNRTIEEAVGGKVLKSVEPGQQFVKLIHDQLVHFLGDEKSDLQLKGPDTLSVIMLMGIQGSGKTTTAAKIAKRLRKDNRKPVLIAADLVRPAAVEQLKILGSQIGVDVYSEPTGDPLKVLANGLKYARKELFDTAIVDTTGRLHVDSEMMTQLQRMQKIASPDECLLVADAMTGQQAVEIAREFAANVDLNGIILTKFDSDTRGGAALSIKTIVDRPIKFIGIGEKIDDIDLFYPERIATRILGMGDIVTLVEKVQEQIEEKDAVELQRKMESAAFSLEDYLEQLLRIKKMGPMRSLMEMMPVMQNSIDSDKIDEKEMIRETAIIQSMTRYERKNYRIIGPSRRKRIAKGSGTSVFDINRFLKKFEKTRLMMKKVTRNKKYQAQMMAQLGNSN